MNKLRAPPPVYSEKLTIALFGKRIQLKNTIGNMILTTENEFSSKRSTELSRGENSSFVVINTPDFFDEDLQHPDQQTIDFMAMSYPGPNLFILAIDSENSREENVIAQITKLQDVFGQNVTNHLVVMVPDLEIFKSLSHLKEVFQVNLVIPNENLADECRKWYPRRQAFSFHFKDYSREVVLRRKKEVDNRRDKLTYGSGAEGAATSQSTSQQVMTVARAPEHHIANTANGVPNNIFNIVLLGLTGTGKSASANTILAAGNSQDTFRSEANSVPVTTCCEEKTLEKPFGKPVRVVDTPDFFHEELRNPERHIEECRKYCQPGQCVVLLVLQIGRFIDGERGILEKLESRIGWKLRESTIVMLTHGDEAKNIDLGKHVHTSPFLYELVAMCDFRYHLFNNKSRDRQQVIELIKKIPNYKNIFPKFTKREDIECKVF